MNQQRITLDDVDLRRLDPTSIDTSTRRQDRSRSATADQMLARILTTPQEEPFRAAGEPRQRDVHRRWWVLGGVAAAATAVAVVVPSLLEGGSSAFASWTPTPTPLSDDRAAALQADCLSTGAALGFGGAQVAGLSEARGTYSFTVVATPIGVGNCFLLDEAPVGTDGEQEQGAVSWGLSADLPAPAPDGTAVSWGATSSTAAGTFTSAIGRVGDDVTAVRLTTADGRHVLATVADGYFAAWWPGKAEQELTIQVTLKDGRTAERLVRSGER
ncbi:hypothetical protein SAMN06264364_13142 [Quadrisphaera granulorum]|uniref:Uncharacterized protein n=1 Tax=Quadrisphaera granulorum TaxID=317664 RepID=A0A316AEV8_9ACTN|nr:hypothetical protein [Quadrisphaera granulorum]PWJ48317.1 hypothetical protein BXY45_13142 [Quadrisphaera granulorum]SZE98478.1 hypothetical protein SAMN06264364_13142 [Quadrisphaera granulorum]